MMILQVPNFRTTFGAKFVDVCCMYQFWGMDSSFAALGTRVEDPKNNAQVFPIGTNLGYPLSLGDAQRPVNCHHSNFGGRTAVDNFYFVCMINKTPLPSYS